MFAKMQHQTAPCPAWCSVDEPHDGQPHDSAAFSVPLLDDMTSLHCRLTQQDGEPVLMEIQDDRCTLARMTLRAAAEFGAILSRLAEF